MKFISFLLWAIIGCFMASPANAQQKDKDSSNLRIMGGSLRVAKVPVEDSGHHKKVYSPRTAAIRSALVPGLGQIYNKKYWKLPIVWGALGITGSIFNYNLKEYRKVRFAYFALLNKDVASYPDVAPELQIFIQAGDNGLASLRTYRNEFRKNIDYSVLFFLLFWGLNVVDATVDAHLKGFDVSNELSLHVQPSFNTIPNGAGLSLVLRYKDKPSQPRHYLAP